MKSRLVLALTLSTLAGAGVLAAGAQAQQPVPNAPPAAAAPPPPPAAGAPMPGNMSPGNLGADQRGPGGMRMDRAERGRDRFSPEDRAAFFDARIAAIHAGLRLTPDQEKLWPAVESAVRDMVAQGVEARQQRQTQAAPADPVERMARMGEMSSRRGAALTKLADAARPLYSSLNDEQKRRLMVLAHPMRGGQGPQGMMGRRGGGEHRDHMGWRERRQEHHGDWRGERGGRGPDREGRGYDDRGPRENSRHWGMNEWHRM